MKNTIKIAIATPGRLKPMGTFSRNYVQYLPYKSILLFGGFIPYFYENTSENKQKIIRYLFAIITFNNQKKIQNLIKNRFKNILQKEKINCVLAEFLNTGSAIREACEELNIPIVSNVLGYEINQNDYITKNLANYQKLANYKSIVIPVAKNMIPKLKSFGFKDSQIFYSPLGARDEFFDIKPNYLSQTFVAIGRFTGMKSPLSTIKAFARLLNTHQKAKLIFAGEGELLADAKNLASELNISHAVNFTGWVSPKEQIEIFSRSAIFLQHSVTTENGDAEGTPVAILEASAAGLPIISTKHGGIIDTVIQSSTGYLVDEYDWESMAEKMIFLLDNPSNIVALGSNGRNFIKENFSMRKHIQDVEKAIEKAISS